MIPHIPDWVTISLLVFFGGFSIARAVALIWMYKRGSKK